MNVFVKLFTELNLGDDLFLKILLERYPNSNFLLNARVEYAHLFAKYKNLKIKDDLYVKKYRGLQYRIISNIERRLFPSLYQKRIQNDIIQQYSEDFQKSDVFVSIGGSIFMQPAKLPYYTDVEYYNIVNKMFDKVLYIGCNFGPFSDITYKDSYKKIFSKALDVCFREEASWRLFNDIEQVRYRPDVVFGLEFPKSEKRNKSVGFSIISAREKMDNDSYIKKYVELVEYYQNIGYEIFFFSFCKKQGDEKVIEEIIDYLRDKRKINTVFYNGDIDKFLKVYSSVEKVYCGRFHSMILSMIFEQKIYPIPYSKKMINVLDDIKYRGEYLNIQDFCLANPRELDIQISKNFYEVREQINQSKEQFEKLDILLK